MAFATFYEYMLTRLENELFLDCSKDKEKMIDKFMEDDSFQREILHKIGLSPLPNEATQGVMTLLQWKYVSV